jgi:Flp pilus assembly protein TadD
MNFLRIFRRVDRWLVSRPWRIFPLCLPALLGLGTVVLALALVLLSQRERAFDQRYDHLTRWLLVSGKFEEARVASLHGLLETRNNRERAQETFYLGLSLNGLGRRDEAAGLFALAAPLDHPGCAEAHLLMAQTLLNSVNQTNAAARSTNSAAQTLHAAERHLLNALALEPQSLEVNEMLGRFYINTHNPAKARLYLSKIYSAKPEVALLLAISCLQDNDQANAILWSDRAIGAYEQNLLKTAPKYNPGDRLGLVQAIGIKQMYAPSHGDTGPAPPARAVASSTPPQDSPALWLGVVRLLLTNGKYGPALQTLDQQMAASSNALYSAAIADVCASWAETIPPSQKEGAASRLQLIEKGLANQPQHLKLQLLLVQATHATDETGAAAKAFLDAALDSATGEAAASWHFAIWTDGRIRGDMAAARQHLRTAYQLAPGNPEIANDLAMDLSTGSRSDVERGLKLIQPLVGKYPYEAGFLDTRGQILAKLGRNEEAVTDLEFAAPRLRNSPQTQQVLEKCLAALGRSAPPPQVHVAVLLADARNLASQQKYAEALQKLEPVMRQAPNAACASAIADICAAWVPRIPAADSAKRLRLIQEGLTGSPQHSGLKNLLLQACRADGATGLAAKKLLDQLVMAATGDAAADWHLTLGQDARSRGDLVAARHELQAAYEIAPTRTQIKAELATTLLGGTPDDWTQGLELIQSAVDQFPDQPEYRNIRGLLLARLGRNKEAAADLELAVAKLPNPVETRLALAKVYDAMGKSQLADRQRHLAAQPGSTKAVSQAP